MQQLRSAIHNAIARFLRNQPPARIIAVGFALLILLGAALLMLPFAVHPGAHVGPLDALFTATSAVCVTGLVVVDTGDTFSLFGQAVIAILIQIGGLGVASIGMGLALVAGRRITVGGRMLGKSVRTLDLRKAYGINIIAVEHGQQTNVEFSADYTFKEGDTVAVIGKVGKIDKFEKEM